ncbi:hypothetical protein GCM10008090_01140 [Arenicella chitinivorans]|uniref:DUF2306 domain-containing protein n=1 Tax=Arenicella chitinivorans TaxID=1329800 RepID=A0A918RGE2_9GAMM|nr:DUF2306 domain-containing protein [Arenicella chitinivorans]GGZ96679.1 hypothetical protein GCM10008090_01140 [Arenicella chitinivorans]
MFSSNIGFVHTVCAVIAILIGALVILLTKGTKQHKMLGYAYFAAMISMNVTALFTKSIYSFGPFHWMAIGSMTLVTAGILVPVLFRRSQNWLKIHYDFMLWSYVGLIAAMFSEVAVRVPAVGTVIGGGSLFWSLVISSSIATFIIGGYMINKNRSHTFSMNKKNG